MSNQTRGLFCVGNNEPGFTATNRIDYITIASTGDAVDFGQDYDFEWWCVCIIDSG